MAKIGYVQKSDKYKELNSASADMHEKNDCSVIAVAAACGVKYEEAHKALREAGRKHGKGAWMTDILDVIEGFGFKHESVNPRFFIDQYPQGHCNVLKSVTTHHMDRFPKAWQDGCTYLISVGGHVLAVVNGVNCDWTKGRARRAKRIYRITKA